jgi:hypothetical protein
MVGIVSKHLKGGVKRECARSGVAQTQDLHGYFAPTIDQVDLADIWRWKTGSSPDDGVDEGDVVLAREWHRHRHDVEKGEWEQMSRNARQLSGEEGIKVV